MRSKTIFKTKSKNIEATKAVIKLANGPAKETCISPLRQSSKLFKLIGTGFAQPI